MKRSLAAVTALLLGITGCSSGGDAEESGPVTLTLAGWSLATTPEFKTLADGFRSSHPDIVVELKEYDAANYDTQMIADLAAGKAPDIYVQKNLKNFYTYQNGKQLVDVSDVAGKLGAKVGGLSAYQVDGKTWAVPYRADSWVTRAITRIAAVRGAPTSAGNGTSTPRTRRAPFRQPARRGTRRSPSVDRAATASAPCGASWPNA